MRRVLMIAFHFPPFFGSSGIQRSLRFVQHLPDFGWEPLVLTASSNAYDSVRSDLLAEIPPGLVMRRARAWDCARHFSIRGRYLACMARPDRWISWQFAGIREGLRLIDHYRPEAIWSTHPIPTAHLIAAALHGRRGLPWIADFRDPMTKPDYPEDPKTRQHYWRIEEKTVRQAAYCVFTTPGAVRDCRRRYPEMAARIALVENGYDEESFAALETGKDRKREPLVPGAITLLHSGIVYPADRNPKALLTALRRVLDAGLLTPAEIRIRFRAPVHDDFLRELASNYGVADCVEICPGISYREALAEMVRADALLVLQAASFNQQIPAKIYEYLRAGRPVLGLTDPAGDTADVLRRAGLNGIARLDSVAEVTDALVGLIGSLRGGTVQLPPEAIVAGASRRGRAAALAALLDQAAQC